MFPGETALGSVHRLLKREVSLDITPERMTCLGFNTLAFAERQQKPTDHGTADVQIVVAVDITEDEAVVYVQRKNIFNEKIYIKITV